MTRGQGQTYIDCTLTQITSPPLERLIFSTSREPVSSARAEIYHEPVKYIVHAAIGCCYVISRDTNWSAAAQDNKSTRAGRS